MNISIIIRSLLLIAFSTIIRADDQLTTSAIVHIYPNFAEILQSVPEFASSSSSPKNIVKIEFNEDEWNDIRADTLMLTVNHHDLKSEDMNLSVTSEAITEKKKSTNGETIFLSDLQNKTAPLIEAKMIDEIRQLIFDVKQQLYYTISPNEHRILYKTLPEIKKYIVTFTYNQSPVVKIPRSSLYVAYLYAKLKWKTQYQLLLFSEKNRTAELTIFANIQNDGMKTIAIDAGQLLSGDINIQMVKWLPQTMPIHHDARQRTHVSGLLGGSRYAESYSPPPPIISSSGQELAGVYRYTIDNPFIIEPKTQFLLPMIKSNVKCERFGLIDQVFSVTKTNSEGKATKSYRLTSDQYLSSGSAIVREDHYIVGETSIPNLAANATYEFQLGEDADIHYFHSHKEKSIVTEIDTIQTNLTLTRTTFEIRLKLKNYKKRPINIEYKQTFNYQPHQFKFTSDGGATVNDAFFLDINDKQRVVAKLHLNSEEERVYTYAIQTNFKAKQTAATIRDWGLADKFKDWVDVQEQGISNDYARYVGNATHNYLSVALAGSNNEHTTPDEYRESYGSVTKND